MLPFRTISPVASSCLVVLLLATSASAAVYTTGAADPDANAGNGIQGDGFIVAWGAPAFANRAVAAGFGDTKVGDEGAGAGNRDTHRTIFKMTLPTLGSGEVVDTVSFAYRYTGGGAAGSNTTPLPDIDVIAFDSTVASLVSGDWDDNTAAITAATSELVWGVTPAGIRTVGGAGLKNAVNQAYANGRDHVALRFQLTGGGVDDLDSAWEVYGMLTAETGDAANRPVLTINTVVPEPAALTLALLSGLALLPARRR